MRTTIKVADLSLAQWAWLNLNLPESREFSPDDVRMCVTLELTAEQSPIHVEMPPREFVVLVERLRLVGFVPVADTGGLEVETVNEALDYIDRTARRPQGEGMTRW